MHLEVFGDSVRRISTHNGIGFHCQVLDHSPCPSAYVAHPTFTWPWTHILTLTEYYVKTRKHQTDNLLIVVLFLKSLHQIAGIFLTHHKKISFQVYNVIDSGSFHYVNSQSTTLLLATSQAFLIFKYMSYIPSLLKPELMSIW